MAHTSHAHNSAAQSVETHVTIEKLDSIISRRETQQKDVDAIKVKIQAARVALEEVIAQTTSSDDTVSPEQIYDSKSAAERELGILDLQLQRMQARQEAEDDVQLPFLRAEAVSIRTHLVDAMEARKTEVSDLIKAELDPAAGDVSTEIKRITPYAKGVMERRRAIERITPFINGIHERRDISSLVACLKQAIAVL